MGYLQVSPVNEGLIAVSGHCRDGAGNILKQKGRLTEPPFLFWSFRDGPKDQTSGAQLRTGESRDSGFDASHRPGMTEDITRPPA
jgi:hypothetical protein